MKIMTAGAGRPLVIAVLLMVCMSIVTGAAAEEAKFLKETFPGGFKAKEPVAFYDQGNLYEYINGQAVFYLSYGFTRLEHGYYENGDATFYVDVYELNSPLSAFGSYRQQRDQGSDSMDAGAEGSILDYLAVFYKGKFYVEIIPMSGDDVMPMMAKLAEEVAKNIPGETAVPPEVDLLPRKDLVEGSERYVDENLISYTFMGRGLVATYTPGGGDREVRIFIAMPGDEGRAQEIYDEYKAKFESPESVSLPVTQAVKGNEPYRGVTIVAQYNDYVFGCLDVKDEAAETALLEATLENLKE